MTQTNISEWLVVAKKIEESKIKRFPYKSYLGVSLTQDILKHKLKGLSSYETYAMVLKSDGMRFMFMDFPDREEDIKKNIWISVCARFSETDTQDKMRGL